jgi:hypothetical protein
MQAEVSANLVAKAAQGEVIASAASAAHSSASPQRGAGKDRAPDSEEALNARDLFLISQFQAMLDVSMRGITKQVAENREQIGEVVESLMRMQGEEKSPGGKEFLAKRVKLVDGGEQAAEPNRS